MIELSQFRESTDYDVTTFCYEKNPLIIIKGDGSMGYVKTQAQKRDTLLQVDREKDLVLFAWSGQWSTDVFKVPEKKAKEILLMLVKSK